MRGGDQARPAGAPAPRTAVVGAVALLAVIGSIGLGLRMPGSGLFRDYGGGSTLDYGPLPPGAFAPLSSRFIEDALGTRPDEPTPHGTTVRLSTPPARQNIDVEHGLTHDDFDVAYQAPAVPFRARSTTAGASRQPGEPSACVPTGGTVWYRFTPQKTLRLVAHTFGSDHPTALGVFTRTAGGDFDLVACDSDPQGLAHLNFLARGTAYYFQLTGLARGGRLTFTLTPLGRRSALPRVPSTPGYRTEIWEGEDPSISADGRFIAYRWVQDPDWGPDWMRDHDWPFKPQNIVSDLSWIPKLINLTRRTRFDVVVHDRVARTTKIASVGFDGGLANGFSGTATVGRPAISAEGRFVAFGSDASNLVRSDSNGRPDVFVRDLARGTTERVSVTSSGRQSGSLPTSKPPACNSTFTSAPSACSVPVEIDISGDGRTVVFSSAHEDLVPGDSNFYHDVFVHDRVAHTTTRISISSDGRQASGRSGGPSVSQDGRWIVFTSSAPDLAEDLNGTIEDVFVHDRATGKTELVSRSSSGEQGLNASFTWDSNAAISADGRFVAFASDSPNLVPGDTNGVTDIFVRDRFLGTTQRVTVNSAGEQQAAPGGGGYYSLSGEGRYVSFTSNAANLGPDDQNDVDASDTFVHDVLTRTTVRISFGPTGEDTEWDGQASSLSWDGAVVAFWSNERPGMFIHEFPKIR